MLTPTPILSVIYSFLIINTIIMNNVKDEINRKLIGTPLEKFIKIVATQKVDEKPHPFCITGKHIKRYYLDVYAGTCGMRVNPTTGEWSNKRDSKKGIINTCKLPFDQHTYNIILLIIWIRNEKLQLLEDSLAENAYLDVIFKEYKIKGFAFAITQEDLKNEAEQASTETNEHLEQ